MLKLHDWFYDYSNDLNVYRSGLVERMEIMSELNKLPHEEGRQIILDHAPIEEQERMLKRLEFLKDQPS